MSEGRGVFITGGSRGIGRALVKRFTDAGDRVAATSRSADGAQASGAELPLVADVTDPEDVAASMARAKETFGRLDIVIHNAGRAGAHGLSAEDDETFMDVVDVNLLGAWYVARCAAEHLSDGGRLLFVGSTLSLRGVPDQPAYVAAKHGVLGLSRSLALRLAPRHITVNTLTPGWVRTDMAQQRADEIGISVNELGADVPLGRVAEPREIAELAFFVASESAAMITGQALSLDGGLTA